MPTIWSESPAGFDAFLLNDTLKRGVGEAGFLAPRPIQTETIPAALQGRDILALAPTGTGKTVAFALPILQRLSAAPRPGPRVLIVAPTRELAMQINEEIKLLGRFTRVKSVTLFGGVSSHSQIAELKSNPEIVVACPGRLLDLFQQGVVSLARVETLILDEADHMFDMGFLPDIRRIISALPAKRQNLMFSATMPEEIRKLAEGILKDPHLVDLTVSGPLATIEHVLYPVDSREKLALLRHLCADRGFASAIVFTRTKHRARRLAEQLSRSGHRAVALQGNMTQPQRNKAMEGFRHGQFDILVATDIAARGIDVRQVSHVVNFDMPSTVDAYTHRIGRTGRAEREGKAYTFVTGEDVPLVSAVERSMGMKIPRQTVESLKSESRPNARRQGPPPPLQRRRKFSGRRKGASSQRS